MAPGFAHGFCVLSESADLHYKVSQLYDQTDEGGVYWADRDIGIQWPLEGPQISPRDNVSKTARTRARTITQQFRLVEVTSPPANQSDGAIRPEKAAQRDLAKN